LLSIVDLISAISLIVIQESISKVMVHRGIYEAAKTLYEEVLPCIRAHVEAHNENARLQFTGHSLGGSLAVLLSLMVGVRNEAPVSALLPVYTFGSPCIMCGGNYLLAQLGLPRSHIQSVVMHMDIVPRTFACDYPDHFAVVLKRVSGPFRNYTCLLQQVRIISNRDLFLSQFGTCNMSNLTSHRIREIL
jgi:hypothetical protein